MPSNLTTFAYLVTSTCTLIVYGARDWEESPVVVSRFHFGDRELCDWLVNNGVTNILLRHNDDKIEVTDEGRKALASYVPVSPKGED